MYVYLIILVMFTNGNTYGVTSQQVRFSSVQACNIEAVKQNRSLSNGSYNIYQTAYCIQSDQQWATTQHS